MEGAQEAGPSSSTTDTGCQDSPGGMTAGEGKQELKAEVGREMPENTFLALLVTYRLWVLRLRFMGKIIGGMVNSDGENKKLNFINL